MTTTARASAAGWQFSKPSVVPGFGLALGFSLAYLTLIILIPLSGLAWRSAALGWSEFWAIATDPRVVKSLELSFGTSLIAAAVTTRSCNTISHCRIERRGMRGQAVIGVGVIPE